MRASDAPVQYGRCGTIWRMGDTTYQCELQAGHLGTHQCTIVVTRDVGNAAEYDETIEGD